MRSVSIVSAEQTARKESGPARLTEKIVLKSLKIYLYVTITAIMAQGEVGSTKAIQLGDARSLVLALRLITLMILVALLTLHLRSVKVFRWEYSVTGGLLVAFCIAVLGLALCAGIQNCGGKALQAYLCATGGTLLAVNATAIWRRWKKAGELTRVVAELLVALGVMLKRQVTTKVFLSAAASIALLLDLFLTAVLKFSLSHTV